jgi:hypothetical protein
MALLRGLFWVVLFILLTFCFVVLFEYGPHDFANGVQKEYARVKSFVVKQAETEEEPLMSGLRGGAEDRAAMSLSKIRGSCFENFYRQGSKKFFCILDLQNRSRLMCCKKTGVWRSSNPRFSPDLTFG